MDAFQQVRLGNIEFLKNVTDADMHVCDKEGRTLVYEAIAYGRTEIALALITRGVSASHADNNGQTPLHFAALHRNRDVADALLRNGADPNQVDKHGNNALWTAVFNARGQYEIVTLLRNADANANSKNNSNRSPLDFARTIGDEKLVSMLER